MVKVLAFGGSGLVGSRFIQLNKDNFELDAPDTSQADILDKDQLLKILEEFEPQVVINFAAYTDVQAAEKQQGNRNGLCYKLNADGAKNVAEACQEFGKHLIHISTDYVFDGNKSAAPYTEEDKPDPKNWYGLTKYIGEQFVQDSGCRLTIVRVSMPFSSHYELKLDIARFFLRQLRENKEINAITDQKVTPVFVDDVAKALSEIIKKDVSRIYHVVSTNWTSPYELSKLIAKAFSLNKTLIKPITLDEYNQDKNAKILRYSWLDCSKFVGEFGDGILHTIEESINLFKQRIDLKLKIRYINSNG